MRFVRYDMIVSGVGFLWGVWDRELHDRSCALRYRVIYKAGLIVGSSLSPLHLSLRNRKHFGFRFSSDHLHLSWRNKAFPYRLSTLSALPTPVAGAHPEPRQHMAPQSPHIANRCTTINCRYSEHRLHPARFFSLQVVPSKRRV